MKTKMLEDAIGTEEIHQNRVRREKRQLTTAEENLKAKFYDIAKQIGIPDGLKDDNTYYPERKEFHYLTNITREEIYDTDVKRMIFECPDKEEGHALRVAFIEAGISKILGFGKDARITSFLLGIIHDEGKLKMKDFYPENNPYENGTREYIQYLKEFKHGHVAPQNLPVHWDPILTSAVEQHHRHQKEKYPSKLSSPWTRESYFLSKTLAIADLLDTLSSRPCRYTGRYRSPEEAVAIVLQDYGNMEIKYNGNLFPQTSIIGRELIQELQKRKIVGRTRPVNVTEDYFRINPFDEVEIK
jgi:hypothetical protein